MCRLESVEYKPRSQIPWEKSLLQKRVLARVVFKSIPLQPRGYICHTVASKLCCNLIRKQKCWKISFISPNVILEARRMRRLKSVEYKPRSKSPWEKSILKKRVSAKVVFKSIPLQPKGYIRHTGGS